MSLGIRRLPVLAAVMVVLINVALAGSLTSIQLAKLHPALQALVRQNAQTFDGQPGLDAVPLVGGKAELIIRTDNAAALRSAGIRVVSELGTVATVLVSPQELETLASLDAVQTVEVGSVNYPQTDVSVPQTGATLLHGGFLNGTPYRGHGAIVLIYDTGIDWRHRDFCDPLDSTKTRILSIWDQTLTNISGENSPSGSLNFGPEYTKAQIEAELNGTTTGFIREADVNGHGTHVAGTAAGNGSTFGGKFEGMAPDADIVVVKGGNGSFNEANMIDGLAYAELVAERAGKPVVLNWSIGGHQGPHDGTRAYETAVDAFVANPGRVVCISAGNEGGSFIHQGGDFSSTQTITIAVPTYTPTGGAENDRFLFDIWFTNADPIDVSVHSPGGFVVSRSNGNISSPTTDGTIDLSDNSGTTVNGHRNITLYVHDANSSNPPAHGSWTITLTNSNGIAESYDGWLVSRAVGQASVTVTGADNNKSVAMPGTSNGAITVGSYVTKWTWPSYGPQYFYTGPADRTEDISTFSSIGPTADGRLKPDLVAPGQGIVAPLSRSVDTTNFYPWIYPDKEHFVDQGTSMASPHVTGAVALLLGMNPNLSAAEIKTMLVGTSRTDAFTGSVPNYVWGEGKLDILNGMAGAVSAGGSVTRTTVTYDQPTASNYLFLNGTQKAAVRFNAPPLSGTVTGMLFNIVSTNYRPWNGLGNIQGELYSDNVGLPGARIGSLVSSPISMFSPGTMDYLQMVGAGTEVSGGGTYHVVLSLSNPLDTIALFTDQAAAGGRSHRSNGSSWVSLSNNLRIRPIVTSTSGINAVARVGQNPQEFSLLQNYPNPFNPSTNIGYTIASSKEQVAGSTRQVGMERVRLVVYDLLGREVAVLVDGYQTPGEHRVAFDARTLASGVYFYRLAAGGQSLSRKLVLLK